MSTSATIEKYLIEELAADDGSGGLAHDEDLLAAELIDSLGIQQLVTFLEDSFGIEVGDDDLQVENFRTVDAIAAFVDAKRA